MVDRCSDALPRCKKSLTLTTTLTLPPGVMLSGGGVATATGVLDRREGLEADDIYGVLGRSSPAMVRGGAIASHRSSIQSEMTVWYRYSREEYMKLICLDVPVRLTSHLTCCSKVRWGRWGRRCCRGGCDCRQKWLNQNTGPLTSTAVLVQGRISDDKHHPNDRCSFGGDENSSWNYFVSRPMSHSRLLSTSVATAKWLSASAATPRKMRCYGDIGWAAALVCTSRSDSSSSWTTI